MSQAAKKAIKLPKVLIQLGTVEKIEAVDGKIYKWTVRQKCGLFCGSTGNTLFCLLSTSKAAPKDKFLKAIDSRKSEVARGLDRYEDWHEFDPNSGSLVEPPRGFLFFVGRAKSIIYRSDKWVNRERRYIHTFKNAPKIWVNKYERPTLLTLTGGKTQITKDGIKG